MDIIYQVTNEICYSTKIQIFSPTKYTLNFSKIQTGKFLQFMQIWNTPRN